MNKLTDIILSYKDYYNTPRPYSFTNIFPINPIVIPSSKSPSYPSGHAASYRYLYRLFTKFDPNNEKKYYSIYTKGYYSRMAGGIHFPMDIKEGIRMADTFFNTIYNEKNCYI